MGLELKQRALIKLNLKLFLDMTFLRESCYMNVSSGQQFYDGSDMSILLPDTINDNQLFGVSDGQVWQSPFRQWIYESGVALDGDNTLAPIILASGVYIEGAFRPTNDPDFGHTIDYINGRIIFDTPQPLTLQVNGQFSTRQIRVDFENQFNQQFNKGYIESKFGTNPLTSYQLVYPSGLYQPFPAVFIEVADRDFEAYELGNRSAIIKDKVNLYVWALDDLQRDNIVDILTSQWRKNIPAIDFNKVPLPLSGIYNTISPEYIPYQAMLKNNQLVTTLGSGTPIKYFYYLDDVTAQNQVYSQQYERSMVTFNITTYLNAPVTPLGGSFGPISTPPTLDEPFS